MNKAELIKKLKNETGLTLGMIVNIVQSGMGYESAKKELFKKKKNDVERICAALDIALSEAEKLYIEYNCSADRCIAETRKKRIPVSVDDKKKLIESRLNKGELLIGEVHGRSTSNYHWITVKKRKSDYLITIIGFEKTDIDSCLDLIYSDATELQEIEQDNLEDVFLTIQKYIDILQFDTRQAYEKYPL
ncbi:hypothetical protein [Spartinivicinus ruber]|uniref:hypothetical protein n=1 Tax=Spartinivicinus ruber TaxID=2683272 RepID=UPI0013D2FDCA|nr:hypothetical protein [Spartinivicinus ruber]